MSGKPAIKVDGISKLYQVGARQQGYKTLRETIADACWAPVNRLRKAARSAECGVRSAAGETAAPRMQGTDFWALKDVSFEVQPGEVVGIIGRNGAGKSTLLKILSRITEPTSGRIELRGRVGSLLEVGTGFHPELTGRENIYMNGSILGMSQREISRKFDEIVSFAEIEDFLDTPVKRYSSGMYVRLAFAVAAHLEPEILIVDEVLAVGDAEFQKKCFAQLRSASRRGCTVLLVSHNMPAIEHLCSTAISLVRGRATPKGDVLSHTSAYLASSSTAPVGTVDLIGHPARKHSHPPILTSFNILSNNSSTGTVAMGSSVSFAISFSADLPRHDFRIGLIIHDRKGSPVLAFSPTFQSPQLLRNAERNGTATVDVPWLNLAEGIYSISLHAQSNDIYEGLEDVCTLEVLPADVFGTGRVLRNHIAATYLPSTWTIA